MGRREWWGGGNQRVGERTNLKKGCVSKPCDKLSHSPMITSGIGEQREQSEQREVGILKLKV